jgi:hypothetical protein
MPEEKTLERAREDARQASRRQRKPVNLSARRWITSAKGNTERAMPNKPLRSDYQRPGGQE